MPRSETVRSLERGLAVLQALHAKPACSLQDLNLFTRIPKPSLLRILHLSNPAGRRGGWPTAAIASAPISTRWRAGATVTIRLPRRQDLCSSSCAGACHGRRI